mmetsp:Transcript_44976/g.106919  ORF Transcript_44976/g.106919 Transcript_44976/m.106919 type:complete len:268 (-) Transcript_44976:85-888(-)
MAGRNAPGDVSTFEIECKNTFLHISERPSRDGRSGQAVSRSCSWTPSSNGSSPEKSSESSVSSLIRHFIPNLEETPPPSHQLFNHVASSSSQTSRSSDPSHVSAEPEEAIRAEVAGMMDFPSAGSRLHFEGKCQPCRFIDHPDGCRNGYECNFCHFRDHDASSAKTHRPSKGVRSGYKRSVNQVMHSDMSEEQKLEAYKKLAERSPYMRCLLRAVVPNIDDLLEEQGHVEAASSKSTDQPRAPGLQPAAQMPRTPGQQGPASSKLSL